MQHHSCLCLSLKHWRQPHMPVWTQLFLRWKQLLETGVYFHKVRIYIRLIHWVFLQFKERDELARIFKLWIQPRPSSSSSELISMSRAWDYRVRQHLGTRYDSKKGCFDWDLTMKLHEKGVLNILFFARGNCYFSTEGFDLSALTVPCSVVSSTSNNMHDGGKGDWRLNCEKVSIKYPIRLCSLQGSLARQVFFDTGFPRGKE